MTADRALPADFAARLRAARAFAGLSQKAFAQELNTDGASSSTIKAWESGGRVPPSLTVNELVRRISATSGLPESFLWGEQPRQDEDRLAHIEQQQQQIRDLIAQLLAAIGQGDKQGDYFDLVRAVLERALSQRAREAGLPHRVRATVPDPDPRRAER